MLLETDVDINEDPRHADPEPSSRLEPSRIPPRRPDAPAYRLTCLNSSGQSAKAAESSYYKLRDEAAGRHSRRLVLDPESQSAMNLRELQYLVNCSPSHSVDSRHFSP
jgi:hypothetical protein